MLLLLHVDDLGGAIGVARVIQVTSLVAIEGRINDVIFVKSEEVAVIKTFLLVNNLSLVCNFVADFFTYVFYHNVVGSKILVGKEPVPMNLARTDFNSLGLGFT